MIVLTPAGRFLQGRNDDIYINGILNSVRSIRRYPMRSEADLSSREFCHSYCLPGFCRDNADYAPRPSLIRRTPAGIAPVRSCGVVSQHEGGFKPSGRRFSRKQYSCKNSTDARLHLPPVLSKVCWRLQRVCFNRTSHPAGGNVSCFKSGGHCVCGRRGAPLWMPRLR